MTVPFLLPVAVLVAAPAQAQPIDTAPPAAVVVPAQAAPPVVVAPPPPPPATPASAEAPRELADPLADPATTTAAAPPTPAASRHYPGDPLEGFNRAMFGIHQGLDKAIYRPAAMGYKHIVPKPVRSGVRNFFSNLTEPVVFANYLLQLRFGKALRPFARFLVNSTIGIGGLFDVAKRKPFHIPHKDNFFGDTLAYYGVGPGPYLFLPLVGPTTLRDILGGPLDGIGWPLVIGEPFTNWRYQFGSLAVTGLDLRAESDADLRALFSGAVDPYATLRSVWLQNRAAEVAALHDHGTGETPATELDDPLHDPGAGTAPPAAKSDNPRELQDPLTDPASPVPH
ncbi:MlaA family lipoprotein [Sphingomonas lycopersici]|uniref:VacJ family lipoprotein n=1 Tax=Sphingomonas lycopersici TaxID=2951807 RepID=A0AA41ZIE2_9SPHN|nr:VacJ family lipoprotein [Sphingomonas lycopersici]MCW6537504.1 VacJ family lipoprotein [Sphingomonas lycopersici]